MKTQHDPSPEEIERMCAEIQSTWTPDEKLRRLRADLRPMFKLADGRRETIDATVYEQHIESQVAT